VLHTSLGDITVALDPELAPEARSQFLKLVETGWYDHTSFHRDHSRLCGARRHRVRLASLRRRIRPIDGCTS
jgi:hypothetical protein